MKIKKGILISFLFLLGIAFGYQNCGKQYDPGFGNFAKMGSEGQIEGNETADTDANGNDVNAPDLQDDSLISNIAQSTSTTAVCKLKAWRIPGASVVDEKNYTYQITATNTYEVLKQKCRNKYNTFKDSLPVVRSCTSGTQTGDNAELDHPDGDYAIASRNCAPGPVKNLAITKLEGGPCIGGAICGGSETRIGVYFKRGAFLDHIGFYAHDNVGSSHSARISLSGGSPLKTFEYDVLAKGSQFTSVFNSKGNFYQFAPTANDEAKITNIYGIGRDPSTVTYSGWVQ